MRRPPTFSFNTSSEWSAWPIVGNRPPAFDLDAQILRFDAAWRDPGAPGPPEPSDFLVDEQGHPLGGEARLRLLAELVMIDMECRWRVADRRDEPGGSPAFAARPTVEDYLGRYPELDLADSPPVALVVNEYRVRCRWGDPPTREEFQGRFGVRPELVAGLESVDRALGRTPPVATSELQCRCPHCRESVPVPQQDEIVHVFCPVCGSSFSLVGGEGDTEPSGEPLQFGRFKFLARLGGGSFGVVHLALDTELDREVAVKVAHRAAYDFQAEAVLVREARAAAGLRHPGIVTIYEISRQDDRTFVVSDYIAGQTLGDWSAARQPTFRQSARLCRTIAEALHYAHTQDVIHRDIKPSNILIDRADAPFITDFGLAKRSASGATVTHDGRLVGTPAYMSPEQALGQAHKCGPPSDVYSLGVILFELLTGELPFRGDVSMILAQVIADEPPSPRKLNAHIPRDLATICLKCMEKAPTDRYATAQDLADDLGRFLRGKPILARPIGRLIRAWRWAKRNPLAVALAGVIVLSTVALLAGGAWHIQQLTILRDDALRNEYITSMQLAKKAFDEGKLDGTLQILNKYNPAAGDKDHRDFAWHYLWRCCHPFELSIEGHPREVTGVVLSPDGKLLATLGQDSVARVFDATDGRLIAKLEGHVGEVNCALFLNENNTLLTGDDAGKLRFWDLAGKRPPAVVDAHQGHIFQLALSPDQQSVATAGQDKTARLWDVNHHGMICELGPHNNWVRGAAWRPDGHQFVTADEKGPLCVWDLSTKSCIRSIDVNLKQCVSFGLHPKGRLAAVGGANHRVQIVDLDAAKIIADWEAHGSWVKACLFTPDGDTLITAGHDRKFVEWDVSDPANPRETRRVAAHLHDILAASLSDDGTKLLTGGRDGSARLWRRPVEVGFESLRTTKDRIGGIALSEDEKHLAVVGATNLYLWDFPGRRELYRIGRGGIKNYTGAAFAPDGRWLVTANGILHRWDLLQSDPPRQPMGGPTGYTYRVAIHPTHAWVVTNEAEERLSAWDLFDATLRAEFTLPKSISNNGFGTFAFSPDGEYLAAHGTGFEGRVVVWRTADQSNIAGNAGTTHSPSRPTESGSPPSLKRTRSSSMTSKRARKFSDFWATRAAGLGWRFRRTVGLPPRPPPTAR